MHNFFYKIDILLGFSESPFDLHQPYRIQKRLNFESEATKNNFFRVMT